MKIKYLFFLFIIFTLNILAQSEKFAIEIIDNTSDNVGESLVYQIKEKIRESNSLRLTLKDEGRMQIEIKTLSYEKSQVLTIYTVIWILKPVGQLPIYYESTLGYVGIDRINNVAISLVAQTDRLIEELKKTLNEINSNSGG